MPMHRFSDDQPKGDRHPLHRCVPLSWGWGLTSGWVATALLILISILGSTLLANWLACQVLPPPLQFLPHHTALPSFEGKALGPWDSRPCAAAPGPLTCDGRLALAPEDMQNFAHPQGSGACFDKDSVRVTQNIVATGTSPTEILGKLSLWWFPRCQSHAAEIYLLGDEGSARLSVELHVLHPGTGPWQEDASYTAIYTSGERTGDVVWTVLIWSPAAAVDVTACGSIIWQGKTGRNCTPRIA
jgi:hypothetical protein